MAAELVTLTHDAANNGYHLDGVPFCSRCGSPPEPVTEELYREAVLSSDGVLLGHRHLCGCCMAVTWSPAS
jgi:hypothetical protein